MLKKVLYASAAIVLSLSRSMAMDGAPITTEPDSSIPHQEGFALLFDKPEGIIELPETFQKVQECGDILTPEQEEEKARQKQQEIEQRKEEIYKSTHSFMAQKNRKKFCSLCSDDIFTSALQENARIPITYLTGLSIDGGGTRGLIPALLLEELSRKLNKPLSHYFDYIGGTSIGGILALGLTAPGLGENDHRPLLEVNDLVQLFYDRGQDIFPTKNVKRLPFNLPMRLWDGLRHLVETASSMIVSQYDVRGLEGLLKEKFGERAFLHEVLTNILITAVDTGEDRPQTFLFDSRKYQELHKNDGVSIPIWEVGRSTSAAPTYFPAYKFKVEDEQGRIQNSHTLVDGGLWLNNPSNLVAKALLNFASKKSLFVSQQNMIMLSLGTGYSATNKPIHPNAGKLDAVVPLIDTLMNVSSFGVHESMKEILGDNYRRINPQLQNEIKLDETDRAKLDILKSAAEDQYEDIEKFIDGPFRKALEVDEFSRKRKREELA